MKNKLPLYLLALLSVAILFNSCKKEYEDIKSIDDKKIADYIQANHLTMTKDPSGFYYEVIDPGTGGTMQNSDSVLFNFTFKSLSGTTYYEPEANFNLGEYLGYLAFPYNFVINGAKGGYPGTVFRTSVSSVQRGGKVRVIIPSYLAYGKNGTNVIPSNEIIVADISVFEQSKQWELDDIRIQAFLAANSLTANKETSRIYRIVNQAGTGSVTATASSTVEIKYTGRLLNGTIFDQTGDGTNSNAVSAYVTGFEKALIGSKAGTKMRVFIPSDLAYGSVWQSGIPQNSILDFDIEVVNVTD